MEMDVCFASDLDYTLMHSFRYYKEGDRCVEMEGSFPRGFMSGTSASMLRDIVRLVRFVPITTRAIGEYNRIRLLEVPPRHALVSNGGNLWVDGKYADPDWFSRSVQLSSVAADDFVTLKNAVAAYRPDGSLRHGMLDGLYYCIECDEAEPLFRFIQAHCVFSCSSLHMTRNKVYLFPDGLSKGHALNRLRDYFKPELVICAGDSDIDIGMLNAADIAIVPPKLAPFVQARKRTISFNGEGNFEEFVLSTVRSLVMAC
ncbi:MAG: HAD hydrolase family protein [Sphaerochaetaceae bacterium]|nr:HAD hydrolase family protein [Sphaerochaetaceae bacterium]